MTAVMRRMPALPASPVPEPRTATSMQWWRPAAVVKDRHDRAVGLHTIDGPTRAQSLRGAGQVVTRATAGARLGVAHPALVDGAPGVLITVDGRPVTVMGFTVTDGVITMIRTLTDPRRLAQVVPSWVA